MTCGTLAAFMYFRKKRFATVTMLSSAKHPASVQSSINSVFSSLFKSTAFVIIASIFAAMLIVAGLSSTFSASAYADGNGGLTTSTNKVTATVNEDGSVSFSSISLANNTEDVFTLESSIVSIADDAKSVTTLNSANFTIYGFEGTVFSGNPNGQTYTASDTNKINPTESTDLTFELTDVDKSSLESLCGKSVFKITLKGQFEPVPEKTAKGILYQDASGNDTSFEFVYDNKTYMSVTGVAGFKEIYTINYNTYIKLEPSANYERLYPE